MLNKVNYFTSHISVNTKLYWAMYISLHDNQYNSLNHSLFHLRGESGSCNQYLCTVTEAIRKGLVLTVRLRTW